MSTVLQLCSPAARPTSQKKKKPPKTLWHETVKRLWRLGLCHAGQIGFGDGGEPNKKNFIRMKISSFQDWDEGCPTCPNLCWSACIHSWPFSPRRAAFIPFAVTNKDRGRDSYWYPVSLVAHPRFVLIGRNGIFQ